jgi:hypothetical protein
VPELEIPPHFKKVMAKKPARLQAAIIECLARLGDNPRHPGLRTHPVRGTPGVFEAYVDIKNRVTFEWRGSTIWLRNNCHHDMLNMNP